MKISVIIPAYNCEATIQATLESVLRQTLPPDEILVMNDGSTDQTASLLRPYEPRVTVLHQSNAGMASARNALCARAQGDLIAFIDSDDLWHPDYLQIQYNIYRDHPEAVAFFAGHVNFNGYGRYEWAEIDNSVKVTPETLAPSIFLTRYHNFQFPFSSPTFCCLPHRILERLGDQPFRVEVSGACDFHLLHVLPLMGPIVFTPIPLAAYRITGASCAANSLKLTGLAVRAMELVESRYRTEADLGMRKTFNRALPSKRREYAKRLMSAGRTTEAREQLWSSMVYSFNLPSIVKSMGLLLFSYMPASLQPAWLPHYREASGTVQGRT